MSRYVKPPGTPAKRRRRVLPQRRKSQAVSLPHRRYHYEELADIRYDEREEIRAVLDRWRFD